MAGCPSPRVRPSPAARGRRNGALRRANLSGNDTVAIFGQGPVGLSATQLAVAMGRAGDRAGREPRTAGPRQGVRRVGGGGPAPPTTPRPRIRELTGGHGVDAALDTSSSPEARISAIRSSKVWGTMVCVGEGGDVRIDVSPDLLRRQLTVVGSWTFLHHRAGGVRAVRAGAGGGTWTRCSPDRWRLEQAAEAYRSFDAQTGGGRGCFCS